MIESWREDYLIMNIGALTSSHATLEPFKVYWSEMKFIVCPVQWWTFIVIQSTKAEFLRCYSTKFLIEFR